MSENGLLVPKFSGPLPGVGSPLNEGKEEAGSRGFHGNGPGQLPDPAASTRTVGTPETTPIAAAPAPRAERLRQHEA